VHAILLCQSESSQKAAVALLEALDIDLGGAEPILQRRPIATLSDVVDAFSQLTESLALCLAARHASKLGNPSTVVVDHVRANHLCAWSDASSWETAIAMLVLAFPDVHWVFLAGFDPAADAELTSRVLGHQRLMDVAGCGLKNAYELNPLFDGAGLREFVRTGFLVGGKAEEVPFLAKRLKVAVAIDDEDAPANLHAYCAYRNGHRAEVVSRVSQMHRLFSTARPGLGFDLSLQDLSLVFADRPSDMRLMDPSKLLALFPGLATVKNTVLVTSGQDGGDAEKSDEKAQAHYRPAATRDHPIFKPVGDVFEFWREVNKQPLWASPASTAFRYLDMKGSDTEVPAKPLRHAAPGRLMLVAQMLIRRAEALRPQDAELMDALRGAVFATDALELLAGKTPTLSLEALSLKHQFEVKAETCFVGSRFHAENNFLGRLPRQREIERDCTQIASWFTPKVRAQAALNAQMRIASAIIKLYRATGHFEEETAYLRWARDLEWRIKEDRAEPEPIKRVLIAAARHYYCIALQTPSRICRAIGVWLVLIFFGFWWAGDTRNSVLCYVSDTATTFFSVGAPYRPHVGDFTEIKGPQPSVAPASSEANKSAFSLCIDPNKESGRYAMVVVLSIVLGVFHLGALIALAVTRLNRK
jgi:hypothetical protein